MTRSNAPTKPVSLKLDTGLKDRIDALAAARDRSPHWLMHNAIASFVEREERLEALREAAQAAYDDYALTGLHVSEERADEWLAKLARSEDAERPAWQS